MKRTLLLLLHLFFFCFTACTQEKQAPFELVLLQINDVYEITPLENGLSGGLARVATYKKQTQAANPNTLLLHAGDFVNPSAIGNLPYQGAKIRGKQMIEVMNACGIDLVTFGNHEFDINEGELLQRINESTFDWVSSNVYHKIAEKKEPFCKNENGICKPIPAYKIYQFKQDKQHLKMGVISVTIDSNPKSHVIYEDYLESAKSTYERIKDSVDFVIALTHLSIEQDSLLAVQIPDLKLILGGHEHDNTLVQVGNVIITKADANARTVYKHSISYDFKTKSTQINPELVKIDHTLPDDADAQKVVQKWTDIAFKAINAMGFDPENVLAQLKTPLDGREATVRNQSGNLSTLLLKSFAFAAPKADFVFVNGGSIRIDDQLVGKLTEYDILRILPFGGSIAQVRLSGQRLIEVAQAGLQNKGTGGYIHGLALEQKERQYFINGKKIDPKKIYLCATSDFLLTGAEANMSFLIATSEGVQDVVYFNDPKDPRSDVRKALVDYLKANPTIE